MLTSCTTRTYPHVLLEPLGDVLGLNLSRGLERPKVDDELVRASAVFAAEQNGVVVLQALGHVVGVEDRRLGRLAEPL